MQKKKYGCYFLFCLLELLIFMLFSGKILREDAVSYLFRDYFQTGVSDGSYGSQGEKREIYTEEISLPKGIYEIALMYEKGKGRAVCYADCNTAVSGAGPRAVYSDHVSLSDIQDARKFSIYVNEDGASVKIVVEPDNPDDFNINWITIATADNSKINRIFIFAVKLLVLNAIAYVIYYRKRKIKWGNEVIGVIIIGGIASLGLMEEYILYGHDLIFHLFRIEGLAEGLKAGDFPVRIQPGWFNGWGYPVSVMYGDGLLLFPAALRLLGVSVQNAYKCYIAAINLATAGVAYYTFFQISRDKRIGLFGSCIYTLFPYRLSCVYVRAAVGEYSAMLFLPLVVLGFYFSPQKQTFSEREYISESGGFTGKKKENARMKYLIATVIGFSGLIQTHVISCFLAAFAIILFCITNLKEMLNRNRLLYFAEIFAGTVLVNLWFLVPFFRYMQEDFTVNLRHGMEPAFQNYGASLAELFAVYWNGTLNMPWGAIAPLSEKFPRSVGTTLLIFLAVAVLMYHKGILGRQKKKIALCAGFFVLFSFMASILFPYREINKILPAVGSLFGKIQFPYRFLTLAGVFGSLLAVLVLINLSDKYGKKTAAAIMALTGFLAVMQGAQLIYSTLYRGDMCLVYDIAAFESNAVSTGEYLYEGSWGPATEALQVPEGDGVKIEGFVKKYHTVSVICKAEKTEASLLIPLYYYPGYTAADLNTGERFIVQKSGNNNQICVLLPEGYEGTLQVRFQEPVSWRLAEVVSGISILIFLLMSAGFFEGKFFKMKSMKSGGGGKSIA